MEDLCGGHEYFGCLEHTVRGADLACVDLLVLLTLRAHCRIQTILISHFLLNLRRTRGATVASTVSHFSAPNFHIPTFPDIVEDMGRVLSYEWDGRNEDTEQHASREPPESVTGPSETTDGVLVNPADPGRPHACIQGETALVRDWYCDLQMVTLMLVSVVSGEGRIKFGRSDRAFRTLPSSWCLPSV